MALENNGSRFNSIFQKVFKKSTESQNLTLGFSYTVKNWRIKKSLNIPEDRRRTRFIQKPEMRNWSYRWSEDIRRLLVQPRWPLTARLSTDANDGLLIEQENSSSFRRSFPFLPLRPIFRFLRFSFSIGFCFVLTSARSTHSRMVLIVRLMSGIHDESIIYLHRLIIVPSSVLYKLYRLPVSPPPLRPPSASTRTSTIRWITREFEFAPWHLPTLYTGCWRCTRTRYPFNQSDTLLYTSSLLQRH